MYRIYVKKEIQYAKVLTKKKLEKYRDTFKKKAGNKTVIQKKGQKIETHLKKKRII